MGPGKNQTDNKGLEKEKETTLSQSVNKNWKEEMNCSFGYGGKGELYYPLIVSSLFHSRRREYRKEGNLSNVL